MLLILLVVQAFGAAAVGYFSNLPLTYIGGLAIGIAASVSTKYVGTISVARRAAIASLPFIVLFIALLVTPKRLLDAAPHTRPLHLPGRPTPRRRRVSIVIGIDRRRASWPFVPDSSGTSSRTGRSGLLT